MAHTAKALWQRVMAVFTLTAPRTPALKTRLTVMQYQHKQEEQQRHREEQAALVRPGLT